ncbi:Crp/Fnr family transcriptional regulator [Candidatus Xianfuyuplasma coldseepsis]|uniref:Crp/Fnr family transcriptional regulator n=1 Tax=Candidatus Xianfuyuplasma coldseepsis TaxID=2782163 RepID=A0A7L7KQ44_9MOLU|nr:Crp/Fnr family transcriptional regulator [Xianfuyuplasma coldseepsis]QMS84382.1 Crp/Fnr family transcriptional regulator [Xianfuyuplasma coldseepsis]
MHGVVTFRQGQQIFLEGSSLTSVYRIRKGLVKINRIHHSGDEKIFDILGPDDYIALLAVLQGKNEYVASAIALTEVTVTQMSTSDVLQAYQSNNIFQATCLQCAVTRSTMFQDKLFHTTNIDIEEKILATLQLLAKKFGTIEKGSVLLKLPFTKTVLASIVGIRRETLSRKLSDMQHKNIIQVDKNIYKFDRL